MSVSWPCQHAIIARHASPHSAASACSWTGSRRLNENDRRDCQASVRGFIVRGWRGVAGQVQRRELAAERLPAPVETALYRMPAIVDAAVVAMPDPRLQERACAFATVRRNQSVSLDEVCRHLAAEGFSKHFWPERLELLAEMPRTPTGKIQKFVLRELAKGLAP